MNLYQKLLSKEEKLSVIGLGYVGLPIALAFARKISVIGFDIHAGRVEMMKKGMDPSEELPPEEFENCDIIYTANPEDLRQAKFHIVAVPTPIDKHNLPDMTPLLKASHTVGKVLKKGDYVVYESTVYPGAHGRRLHPHPRAGIRIEATLPISRWATPRSGSIPATGTHPSDDRQGGFGLR
jgi:UDP-N-acetyl-D-glucosamine/UDP-N-acetyl-D-galactosamine dehydrogenase